jgi:hypothetical protein
MNNIFKPKRFGMLFIKFTTEQYKGYLMSLLVLMGVLTIGGCFMVYLMNVRMEISLQLLLLLWVILFAGTIFTSTIFTQLSNSKKAIVSLTLPATHFEKYLVAWLYSFIIFMVVVIIGFYLVMLFLLNIRHFPGPQEEIFNLFYNVNGLGTSVFFVLLTLYGLLHSIAFYGALYFQKMNFVKTALLFFLIIGVLIIGNNLVMRQMIHRDIIQVMPFATVGFIENGATYSINTSGFIWVGQVVFVVLAFIFWIAAYFRLKEKQV